MKQKKKEEENKQRRLEDKDWKILSFQTKIKESRDLEENLQGLTDHIHENTGSTAVYIGKVINPLRKIRDDDNDRAHVD
jgi:hypothetical protein